MVTQEMRAYKAKQIRYKKPIVQELNLEAILNGLQEMSEACYDIQWYVELGDDTMLSQLTDDEDDAAEFKMEFSLLAAECDRMYDDLQEIYVPECFDDFFVAVRTGDAGGGYAGYDEYEGDYYSLTSWENEVAEQESAKRIMRLTKSEMIEAAHACMKIAFAYIGLRNRYDSLKAAIDIIRDGNQSYLKVVKEIEEQYDKAEAEKFNPYEPETKKLNKLFAALPKEAWVY